MTTDDDAGLTSSDRLTDAQNPWPGLMPYREADHEFFQGRQTESDDLFRLVMRERVTVLLGRSGFGKSSLLQAGLFPRLRQQNALPVYVRLGFSPDQPSLSEQVKRAVLSEAAANRVEAPPETEHETLWEYFHRQNADFWSARNRLVTPVLVFDQFEETLCLCGSNGDQTAVRDAFLTELGDLIEGRPPDVLKERLDANPEETHRFSFGYPPYKIVVSLEEDSIPELEGVHSRIPSIRRNRMRLRRMNGVRALQIVAQAKLLIEPSVAERVVRFVAPPGHRDEALEKLDLEPALLSVCCRELNSKRQQLGQSNITKDLLEDSEKEILSSFYQRAIADSAPEIRAFLEEQLLNLSGCRKSVATEKALTFPGMTHQAIDRMVDRRLIRKEEKDGIQHLELVHDLLTQVISRSRDRRRQLEAEELPEKQAIEADRNPSSKKRTRNAWRWFWLSATLTVVLLVALYASHRAWEQKKLTEQQQQRVVKAEGRADEAERIKERTLQKLREGVKLRQVLAGSEASLLEMLETTQVDTEVRFRATAKEYPYKNEGGLPISRFEMFPDEESLPDGLESLSLITYIMDHPSFQNRLITSGPDTGFTAAYYGVSCIARVTAVIEYLDLEKPFTVSRFDMCKLIGR